MRRSAPQSWWTIRHGSTGFEHEHGQLIGHAIASLTRMAYSPLSYRQSHQPRGGGMRMPVEIIGWIAPRVSSEIMPPSGPPFNAEVIAETARIHEEAGFDRVLIGYFSHAPDGFLIGAHAATVTRRLQFLLAHRPGFMAPTVAARKLATLDHLSGGPTAVHLITGGNDAEQARDGDFTDHDARYRRTQEDATLLPRPWRAPAPFDHQGEFYRVVGAYADIRCQQVPHMPIYGGGGSPAAIAALAPV